MAQTYVNNSGGGPPGIDYTAVVVGDIQASLDALTGGTVQGAMLFRGADEWEVLAPGTALQYIASGGAAADVAWTTLPTVQALLNGISAVQGTMLARTDTAWVGLAPGSIGTVLTSGGAAANLAYALPATVQVLLDGISSTQGAVLYRNADDWVALAVGSAGQQLTTGGAAANVAWDSA